MAVRPAGWPDDDGPGDDLARQLHIGVIRIVDSHEQTTGQEYSAADFCHVYARAAATGVKIIQLLSGSRRDLLVARARLLLGTYGLARQRALWMVDLANEPTLNDPSVMAAIRAEAAYVRRVAPDIPLTIGGWKVRTASGTLSWQQPQDLVRIIGLVDVVCPHLYGFTQALHDGTSPATRTRVYLSEIRHYAHGKPIFLEEWGASNGQGAAGGAAEVQGTVQSQATIYRGVLGEVDAERSLDVLGSTAWIAAPRYAFPGTADGDNTGWAVVLHNGSEILPAASAFGRR